MTDDPKAVVEGLSELAERVEKASGPDRDLNESILRALGWRVVERAVFDDRGNPALGVPDYTASLDAAMTLVPEGATVTLDSAGWYALVNKRPGMGATPALALTAACLRARASLQEEKG